MNGARRLEEAVPGAYDVGVAVAAGCVAEGDRARDDLDEDRAGVGVPAGRVTRLEVEADGHDVRPAVAVDVDRAGDERRSERGDDRGLGRRGWWGRR